ncbi:MAG TPA: type II toxin-antitoxin system VapC family toxin [Chloroflexota bacterium]|nr:type II toxin-antitoxin system VapC family toxin [Chloroflexota bacterium]
MTGRVQRGMLDTCAVIDLPTLDPACLPVEVAIPAIVLAELAQGVAMTTDPEQIMYRSQRLADIEATFAAIPFDREAARRYGTLVALTIAANRDPRPRRIDLMIAATAAAHKLPLYTRNADDFQGLTRAVTVIAI